MKKLRVPLLILIIILSLSLVRDVICKSRNNVSIPDRHIIGITQNYYSSNNSVVIVEPETGKIIDYTIYGGQLIPFTESAFDPNEQVMMLMSQSEILVIQAQPPYYVVNHTALSGYQSHIHYNAADNMIYLLNTKSQENTVERLSLSSGKVETVVSLSNSFDIFRGYSYLDSDTNQLFYVARSGANNNSLIVVNLDTKNVNVIPTGAQQIRSPVFDVESAKLICVYNFSIGIFDLDKQEFSEIVKLKGSIPEINGYAYDSKTKQFFMFSHNAFQYYDLQKKSIAYETEMFDNIRMVHFVQSKSKF